MTYKAFFWSDTTDHVTKSWAAFIRESSSSIVTDHVTGGRIDRDGYACQIPAGHGSLGYMQRHTLHDGLDKEEDRLNTFKRWPGFANVRPEPLAKAGFHYRGIRDEVECFACHVKYRQWRPGQNPLEVHRAKSPACPFLAGALQSKSSGFAVPEEKSPVRAAGQRAPTINFPEAAFAQERIPSGSRATGATGSSGSHHTTPLRSDFYAIEKNRLDTFRDRSWPSWCPVHAEDLARSGFVYTGNQDSVQCFRCEVALRGWEHGDTAEGEHRRHSPRCPFLNEMDRGLLQNVVLPTGVGVYPDEKMKSEQNRLSSFNNVLWPGRVYIQARDLAEAGLYDIGRGDTVRCFHCHVMINSWENGDKPIDEHIKFSTGCTFVRTVQQRKRQQEQGQLQATVNSTSSGQLMASTATRLASFVNWPQGTPVRPEDLAAAGFYYTGRSDNVRCFSCGGSLRGWEPGDAAWSEHAQYFPSCDFLRENAPAHVHKPNAGYDEPWSGISATSFRTSHTGGQGPLSVSSPSSVAVAMPATEQIQRPVYQVSSAERQRGVNYEFQLRTIEMGFERAIVERVIAQRLQEKGSPYTDLTDLIEDLVAEDARAASLESSFTSGFGQTLNGDREDLDKRWNSSRKRNPLAAFDDLQSELNKIQPGEKKVKSSNSALLSAPLSQPLQAAREHQSTNQRQLLNSPEDKATVKTNLATTLHSGPGQSATASGRSQLPAGSEDAHLCKICLDRNIAVVFLECAHVVSCEECAARLFECPICRAPIKAKVRAFFS